MGLEQERIIAYSPGANQDDEFTEPILTQAGLDSILKKTKKSQLILEGVMRAVMVEKVVDLDWELVTRYKIKEEWIWDKQRSERYVRILGIAPMIKETKDDVDYYTELFWLYYPTAGSGLPLTRLKCTTSSTMPETDLRGLVPKALLLELHCEGRQRI